jgi:hypothetical protein
MAGRSVTGADQFGERGLEILHAGPALCGGRISDRRSRDAPPLEVPDVSTLLTMTAQVVVEPLGSVPVHFVETAIVSGRSV